MATYTDNYQLTKPTYAEQADIGVINSNMNIIDDIMHSSQVSLAPAYDSTQTYAEGDVVMYELLMYKCISPTTGVWDGSKWERTTASESGGGGSAELDILGEGNGAVVSFADGASAGLAKCIAEIVPKQAGSGTPSPDNVRAISGPTSVTVTISDGETSTTKTTPLGQTVYGGRLNVLTGELTIDKGMVTFDGSEQWQSMANVGYPIAYRLDGNWGAKNVSVGTANGFSNRYEYSLISLPEQGYRFANNNADTLYVYDKNFSNDLAGFKTSLSSINMQMCFELATPQTVQLTPQEVNSLLGQNNISADTGDVDIVYVKASAPIQPNPTGTPTATLKKLGIEGAVFEIPSGGGGSSSGINYSTTEQKTGQKWIDGKDIYQITIINISVPSNGTVSINTPISIEHLVNWFGTAYNADLSNQRPLPFPGGSNSDIRIDYVSNQLRMVTFADWTGYSAYLTIQYTKITD